MAKNGFGKAGRGDKAMQTRWMKRNARLAEKKKIRKKDSNGKLHKCG